MNSLVTQLHNIVEIYCLLLLRSYKLLIKYRQDNNPMKIRQRKVISKSLEKPKASLQNYIQSMIECLHNYHIVLQHTRNIHPIHLYSNRKKVQNIRDYNKSRSIQKNKIKQRIGPNIHIGQTGKIYRNVLNMQTCKISDRMNGVMNNKYEKAQKTQKKRQKTIVNAKKTYIRRQQTNKKKQQRNSKVQRSNPINRNDQMKNFQTQGNYYKYLPIAQYNIDFSLIHRPHKHELNKNEDNRNDQKQIMLMNKNRQQDEDYQVPSVSSGSQYLFALQTQLPISQVRRLSFDPSDTTQSDHRDYISSNSSIFSPEQINSRILLTQSQSQYHSQFSQQDKISSDYLRKVDYIIANTMTNQQVKCPICLSQYLENTILVILPCSHCFHSECAHSWLCRKPHCPVCRSKL